MELEDRFLIQETLQGSKSAFGLLVERYKGRIYALALSYLGNREDSEDVCQEVFLKAYGTLGNLENRDRFGQWLYGIALNTCRDLSRKRARERHKLEELAKKGVLNRSLSDGLTDDQYLAELVPALLWELREDVRAIVALRIYDRLSYKDIADFTGVSVGSVRGHLYRGLRQLRERLRDIADR